MVLCDVFVSNVTIPIRMMQSASLKRVKEEVTHRLESDEKYYEQRLKLEALQKDARPAPAITKVPVFNRTRKPVCQHKPVCQRKPESALEDIPKREDKMPKWPRVHAIT